MVRTLYRIMNQQIEWYNFTVVFKKRAGVYYQVKKLKVKLRVLHLIILTPACFLNGSKISDIDQLILALILRFGIILV